MSVDSARASGERDVTDTTDDPGALIGAHVGNYVIERRLAQGGMGAVFVAYHPALGRHVAVKFLEPALNVHPASAQRFLEEARVTARLRHPNIVDIFDFGNLAGRGYYVMELLEGHDLGRVMREHGRFSPASVVPYVEQICAALAAAHAAGIVHRDLKPANVFVVNGESTRVKLMDFGVAKLVAPGATSRTRHGEILGTPTHMAPEQALGHADEITPRTDVYALGAILYEMLSGAPVFQHESEVMLMIMHVSAPVPPPWRSAVRACPSRSRPLSRRASPRTRTIARAPRSPWRAPSPTP